MLDQLFPKQANNNYTGSPIAKWVFIAITVLTVIRSLIHMVAPDGGAQSIATIPLDTFTNNGAAAVILIMALWGLSQVLMALIYVVVLWRYQVFIPFMYALIFIEYAMRMVLMHVKPVRITGTAPGHVADYVMVPLALVMLGLSLIQHKKVG
ncbi:MAG: hypothetical protein A3E84_03220 [Gammaproteobacteria bacterium RIFCSPHIGHO2_12_FULL_42_13]|nr:MAG: hypothetical protein A3E84_03220 [Gammaproteobacteria bacterium RIFCSPHIGHO2_12_FULL_42_13]